MSINALVARLEAMLADGEEFSAILETAVNELHETEPAFDWTGTRSAAARASGEAAQRATPSARRRDAR